jgi:sec-independent protein translocase protein TatB
LLDATSNPAARKLFRPPTLPLPRLGQYDGRMSFGETIFLFLLALIIFGPKKLPQIARQVGKALNEFRRASNEFKAQIEAEISQLELQDLKPKELMSQVLNPLPNDEKPEQKSLPPAGSVESSRFSSPTASDGNSEPSSSHIDSNAPHA